jgi:hypothetical protein
MKGAVKVLLIAGLLIGSLSACYGATVGVYGSAGYGPGAWGGYPYPGRYPPMGGGVFVGVCCDDEQEQQDGDALDDGDGAAADAASPAAPADESGTTKF